jgi:type II secretory pathway predicted ATPase ExeA
MDLGDATAYLRHHLALAGRSDQLFADDALARLQRHSSWGRAVAIMQRPDLAHP